MRPLNSDSPLKKANVLFRNGDYSSALELYLEIRNRDPHLRAIIEGNIKIAELRAQKKADSKSKVSTDGKTFVGIASIPSRHACLERTVGSLVDQVDGIGIYLDNYDAIPAWAESYGSKIKFERSQDQARDLGDAGKFFWIDGFKGYYFTCDDDLIYPHDYVARLIESIEKRKGPVAVGWHGSLVLEPFESYYDSSSRRVFSFGAARPEDTPVHILGTGCLGFHTSHLKVSLDDFKTPNMADVYFALLAQEQCIPLLVIKHEKGEIAELPSSQVVSINKHSSEGIEESRHNTKALQTALVKARRWTLNLSDKSLKIGIIGRFSTNQKGGIFKSSKLLIENLRSLGHEVEECCISDENKLNSFLEVGASFDFILAYAPDPNRPDFGSLLDKVRRLAEKGVVCAVNFSVNLQEERSGWIVKTVREINSGFSAPRVFLAAFSNSTSLIHNLKEIDPYIVVIPKTLDPGEFSGKEYCEREGIFLGDLAKLTNSSLTFGEAKKWIEQIRVKLPHVNIYALKHYHTDKKLLDYIKVMPYQKDGIAQMLGKFRLCVCLTPGATFEMIPVEAAMQGTPVIHRLMPQSLSEYISPSGIQVSTPEELGEMCLRVYEREDIWKRLSSSSGSLHNSLHIKNISASIEIGIRKAIFRSKAK